MPSFHSHEKPGRELYKYIIGTIVPRPIAWVATRSAAGIPNLAPFSFFNAITFNPPTVAFSASDREDGPKDTVSNVTAHPEFIVHIVSHNLVDQMNTTCAEFGADVDEFAEAGLASVPGTVVDVPRVAEALVAMECRVSHHITLGEQPPHGHHILGEVLYWHIDDRILDAGARNPIRAEALAAVGRMGGIEYARTTDRFEVPRPDIRPEDPRSVAAHKAAMAASVPPLKAGGR